MLLGVLVLVHPVKSNAESAREQANNIDIARDAVVNINTTYFSYSYRNPWNRPVVRRASGTGFIISENRIITNAHVVSQANTLRVSRPNQRTDYEARVEFIAHDCDLAMLKVDDAGFYKDAVPLEIGDQPELNSSVEVIGFPIGGDRVSITRGIVSRLGMDLYSHSRIDYHLTIQVDAAINPGNSGGPALQNGKVIGVAFQTRSQGENLGYIIPPVVLKRFLKDTEDGHYDGYIELGVLDFSTQNPTLRRALNVGSVLTPPDTGVLVYRVVPGASADGYIKPGDILVEINDHTISESGDVELDGHLHPYSEVVDNLESGAPIHAKVVRDGVQLTLNFPARPTEIIDFKRMNYDSAPAYAVLGGLVFQPLDANLMETYYNEWAENHRIAVLHYYHYFLLNELYRDHRIGVVLTRRLADPVNVHQDRYVGLMVQSVNGAPVADFDEFLRQVGQALQSEKYMVIGFHNEQVPLIMRSADVRSSESGILEKYGIGTARFVPEEQAGE